MSKGGWQEKFAVWAGWLLGGSLVLVMVLGALTLSPDGARLRRLSGAKASTEACETVSDPIEEISPAATFADGLEAYDALVSPAGSPSEVPAGRAGYLAANVIGAGGDVAVYLDGELQGVTPILLSEIAEGVHRLGFRVGQSAWEEEVRVTAGDTTVIACEAPDGPRQGQLVISSHGKERRAAGKADSVLVDGRFGGTGEVSVEVSPGYHSVSFVKPGVIRRDVVLHVPPGSVQYVSASEFDAPFCITGRPASVTGGVVQFEAFIDPEGEVPAEVALVIVPPEGMSLKTAILSRRSSDGAYAGGLSLNKLPATRELRYFYRATLNSGQEIDSPIWTISLGDLSQSMESPAVASTTIQSE